MAGCTSRFGMQSHADVTLASYLARKDDELTTSERVPVVVVVVPLLSEPKLPLKFAIPLIPHDAHSTRWRCPTDFFFDHTKLKLYSLWNVGYLRDNLCGFQMCSRLTLLPYSFARHPDFIKPPQLLGRSILSLP